MRWRSVLAVLWFAAVVAIPPLLIIYAPQLSDAYFIFILILGACGLYYHRRRRRLEKS